MNSAPIQGASFPAEPEVDAVTVSQPKSKRTRALEASECDTSEEGPAMKRVAGLPLAEGGATGAAGPNQEVSCGCHAKQDYVVLGILGVIRE